MFTESKNINLSECTAIKGTVISGNECLTVIPAKPATNENEHLISLEFKTHSQDGYKWRNTDYLIIDCHADIRSKLNIDATFYNAGKWVFNLNYSLVGRRRVKCCFDLRDLASTRFFLPTLPGHLKGHASGHPTNIDSVDSVVISVNRGRDLKEFHLYSMYLTDEIPDLSVNGEPLVDKYGQWKDDEWEGKIHDEQELVSYLKSELERYEAHSGYSNPDWDEYGGWKKLTFEKKGRFYITERDGRKWLVTPAGNAFFSNGVCYGSRMGVHGFVDGMESLFDWLPDKNGEFHDAWTTADKIPEFAKRNGIEAGKGRYMFNFARANMIRAFGADKWWDSWVKINSSRLKEWGFNTISVCVNNYEDERVDEYLRKAKIPFCFTLKRFPKTSTLLFRDFPDVFSQEYKTLSEEFAKQIAPFADNKYFIGYFINNEPEWIFERNTNPAERVLALPTRTATKERLVCFLEEKYGDISMLNQAWKTSFSCFDDLYSPIEKADTFSENSRLDLQEFRGIMLKKYCDVPTKAIADVVPHAINLGMRYPTVTKNDFSGAELFDAFSFNCYTKDPTDQFELSSNGTSVPFIVGEWHYGGSDTGLMSNALVNATTQDERGKACHSYLRKALLCKHCIGAHYFEFNDQPLLGRFDGENMQHGLITVCNQPHQNCIDYFKRINEKMYDIIVGNTTVENLPWEYHWKY